MVAFLLFLLKLAWLSKSRLTAEHAALRQQVIVLQRKVRGRVQLTDSITIVRRETLLRWHRDGFLRYWRPRRSPKWVRDAHLANEAAHVCGCLRSTAARSAEPQGAKKAFHSRKIVLERRRGGARLLRQVALINS